jgi:hypothetical protein
MERLVILTVSRKLVDDGKVRYTAEGKDSAGCPYGHTCSDETSFRVIGLWMTANAVEHPVLVRLEMEFLKS